MFTKFQAYQFTAVQGAGTRKVSVADKIENLFTTPVRNLFNLYIQNFNTIGDARLIFTGLQHGAGNAAYTPNWWDDSAATADAWTHDAFYDIAAPADATTSTYWGGKGKGSPERQWILRVITSGMVCCSSADAVL